MESRGEITDRGAPLAVEIGIVIVIVIVIVK
jgi:hypothetical protein